MWKTTYTTTTDKVTPEQIWRVWSDISLRSAWDTDTEWATLEGPFADGSIIRFKVKNGPKVKMELLNCVQNRSFTDRTKFPGALMDVTHTVEQTGDKVTLTIVLQISGLLSFLWRKLVAEKVAATFAEQTAMLIKVAQDK